MNEQPNTEPSPKEDPLVIFTYSRAEALQEGVLVDLNQWVSVNESGYKCPAACTAAVFAIIERAVNNKRYLNDYKGVIADILWMSIVMPEAKWETGRLFKVIITGAGPKAIYTLKVECGPGDEGEPVVTIMLPEED
jgi:hypothetical protein